MAREALTRVDAAQFLTSHSANVGSMASRSALQSRSGALANQRSAAGFNQGFGNNGFSERMGFGYGGFGYGGFGGLGLLGLGYGLGYGGYRTRRVRRIWWGRIWRWWVWRKLRLISHQ